MRGRTSPRQALIVMATGPTGPRLDRLAAATTPAIEDLLRCALTDAIAALVQIDGATLSVVGEGDRWSLATPLPAGVDLLVPPPADGATTDQRTTALVWALRVHLARGFEHIVAVAPDALPLRPRTVSTALSVLASADLVVGPTPTDRLYLIGVRDGRGADLIADLDGDVPVSVDALLAAAAAAGLVARSVERVPRLGDLDNLDALRAAVARAAEFAPCAAGWLHQRHGR